MSKEQFIVKIGGQDISDQFSGLRIDQSVGGHHYFELVVGSEERGAYFKGNLSENSKKWIGQILEVQGMFKGVISSLSLSRARVGGSDFVISGYSPTVYLDDGIHARSFGEKNLKQIVDDVLKPFQSKFSKLDIQPQYKEKLKYCVQYRESHFQFFNRLAARYGEWFFYDGLQLFFGKTKNKKITRLKYDRDLINFDISMRTLPVNFKLWAYDYKGHLFPNKVAEYSPPENKYAKIVFDKSSKEIYPEKAEVPIHFSMSEKDLEQITALRKNLNLNQMVVVSGASTVKELKIGDTIEIIDPRLGFEIGGTENYGRYIITSLSHNLPGTKDAYTNHFEAIPEDMVLPPLSASPDPPHCELQEAEVLENNDPKGMGRVRVQFIWQTELKGEDKMTPWIRVAAHSSGGEKGLYIVPEKEDRVLIAFEHNHPERPFVLSSVYHGAAKPEHFDPENLKKALKTKGGHEILMNDEKSKESMALTSPTDFSATAKKGNMSFTAKNTITVKSEGGDITITTPTNIAVDADGNITITAKGDITLEATNINLKGKSSINLEAPNINIDATAQLSETGAQVKIEGQATTTVKGGATLNLESPGITNVSGTMLKLN